MPSKNFEPLVDVVVRMNADGVNAAPLAENRRLREVVQAYHETARQFVQKIRELSRIAKMSPTPEPPDA